MAVSEQKATVSQPSDREVKVSRSFNAPRTAVYKAFTQPALLQKWQLGPAGWSMPVCEMDVRVGGRYRWRWRNGADGTEFGFTGTFRDVQPNVRIVYTEEFDPGTLGGTYPEGAALMTVAFDEQRGVTTVTTSMEFASKEARDAALATGMVAGMEQGYQRLEQLLGERSIA